MSEASEGETERAVCRCPSCGYESPPVKAGPNIGCGICPECNHNRMDREITETEL